jgi:uncharacterized membrane protein YfcA
MESFISLMPWVLFPAVLAGFVQSVTGFGAGIIIMIFLPFVLPVLQASSLTQGMLIFLNLMIFYRYRKHVNWKILILPLAFYFPVYFVALTAAIRIQAEFLKPVLGIFLILLSIYFIFYAGKITIRASTLTAFVCAALSAIIDAFFGMGGPPMVIYILAITRSKEEYLGTLQVYFSVCVLYGVTMRILKGQITASMIPLILCGILALTVGVLIGNRVVDRIDADTMKKFVYGVIGLSGVIAFVTSLPSIYVLL